MRLSLVSSAVGARTTTMTQVAPSQFWYEVVCNENSGNGENPNYS